MSESLSVAEASTRVKRILKDAGALVSTTDMANALHLNTESTTKILTRLQEQQVIGHKFRNGLHYWHLVGDPRQYPEEEEATQQQEPSPPKVDVDSDLDFEPKEKKMKGRPRAKDKDKLTTIFNALGEGKSYTEIEKEHGLSYQRDIYPVVSVFANSGYFETVPKGRCSQCGSLIKRKRYKLTEKGEKFLRVLTST